MAAGRQQLHERHVLPDPDPDSESDGGKTLKGDKHAGESEETDDDDPFPCYDVSTDEACARLASLTLSGLPVAETPVARSSYTVAFDADASAKLARFRPINETVESLRALLEARAEPNVILAPGCLSPLRNVICFAHKNDVAAMRTVLLENGATEQPDDKERWEIRRRADYNEIAWLKKFHSDGRGRAD